MPPRLHPQKHVPITLVGKPYMSLIYLGYYYGGMSAVLARCYYYGGMTAVLARCYYYVITMLLVKVMAHGIHGGAAQWIWNWLAGRRESVCISQTFSSWTSVTSDVPQGSVLGPMLYLIYINDLENCIVSKISNFADDTKLCYSSRHPDEVLELKEDLNRLVDWANTWQMNFNIDKCAVMRIGDNNIQHIYTTANQQVIATEE